MNSIYPKSVKTYLQAVPGSTPRDYYEYVTWNRIQGNTRVSPVRFAARFYGITPEEAEKKIRSAKSNSPVSAHKLISEE